jgi:FixJ family two-component response regulator
MVSGTTDVEVARRAFAAGAFDYATKPVDLARLLESVETAVAMTGLGL